MSGSTEMQQPQFSLSPQQQIHSKDNEEDDNNNSYETFSKLHRQQLDQLQIPESLMEHFHQQLQTTFVDTVTPNKNDNSNRIMSRQISTMMGYDVEHAMKSFRQQLFLYRDDGSESITKNIENHMNDNERTAHFVTDIKIENVFSNNYNSNNEYKYGTILVLPHVVTWDMLSGSMIDALFGTDTLILRLIWDGLQQSFPVTVSTTFIRDDDNKDDEGDDDETTERDKNKSKINLVNAIADHPVLWSRSVVLYRSVSQSIGASIVAPPYLPHVLITPTPDSSATASSTSTTVVTDDSDEADCTGPFPFQYNNQNTGNSCCIDVSLLYVSPDGIQKMIPSSTSSTTAIATNRHVEPYLPTIDLVPAYQYPNHPQLRMVRYVALLLHSNPCELPRRLVAYVKGLHADFVHRMHLVRQQQQPEEKGDLFLQKYNRHENKPDDTRNNFDDDAQGNDIDTSDSTITPRFRVYTDMDDPMKLRDPVVGLEANSSQYFTMVDTIDDADIIYSYQSLFSPNYVHYQYIQDHILLEGNNNNNDSNSSNKTILINQYPYEGGFVQKDHLARGLLQQYGLPRPSWSIETYDLDVHLPVFIGSILFAIENDEIISMNEEDQNTSCTITDSSNAAYTNHPMDRAPLWIIKPASGTRSQGHVVTRNVAHILRINDAAGGHRVAQKYIERPVCLNNHKVDCRVIVLMTSAGRIDENKQIMELPTLHMHNTCYFRIANKQHSVCTPIDRDDHESVLTASYLLNSNQRTSTEALRILPQYAEVIKQLEVEYPNGAFDWNNKQLPQIQTMICELFNGMTGAYPQMMATKQSRAVYGVDVMFQIENDDENEDDTNNSNSTIITPKLLEVTFCPTNNAIGDAHVRDEELYRTYNKDIFECLFVNIVSKNITRLQ